MGWHFLGRGATMCDEYLNERTKAYWRALVGEEELETAKDTEIEVPDLPLKIEQAKPKPKPLLR
jgi:hypothetical protein